MKANTAQKKIDVVGLRKEFAKSLDILSKDPKITSNPDWPRIKKGLEEAAKGHFSEWKPPFK